jgi:hypothetical protein
MAWGTPSHVSTPRPILQPSNPIRGSNTIPAKIPNAPILKVQFNDKIAAAQKKANPPEAKLQSALPKKGLIFAGLLILSFVVIAAKLGKSD